MQQPTRNPAPSQFPRVAGEQVRALRGALVDKVERRVVFGAFALLAAACLFWTFCAPVDSDEPQHLHVAWGWTQGMVQYRDFFDNHAPLFHLLTAPVLAAFGERANIITLMRLAVSLPLFAVTLGCVYVVAARFCGSRAGAWAALFTGWMPAMLPGIQFRTDNLWNALWVAGLALACASGPSALRFGAAGVAFGLAWCVSLKTSALMISLLSGFALASVLSPVIRRSLLRGATWERAGVLVVGMAVPPAAMGLWLRSLGVWDDFVRCAINHSTVNMSARVIWSRIDWGFPHAAMLPMALLCCAAAWRLCRDESTGRDTAPAEAVVLLTTSVLAVLLLIAWPNQTRQTMLPLIPLMVISWVIVGNTFWPDWLPRGGIARGGPWIIVAGLAVAAMLASRISADRVARYEAFLGDVVRLTGPDDRVLDAKGECVYRRRVFYPVLEVFTIRKIKRGLVTDDTPERCVATGTCVAVNGWVSNSLKDYDRFSTRTLDFMGKAFVDVGTLSVAGGILSGGAADSRRDFDVAIPAEYAVVTPEGVTSGTLDGQPLDGPRLLTPGRHSFTPATGQRGPFAYVWARATQRGFSPFVKPRP